MAFTFRFDDDHNLVYVTPGARVEDLASSLAAMRGLGDDPRFRADTGPVCDFRDIPFRPHTAALFFLGSTLTTFFRGHRLALPFSDSANRRAGPLLAAVLASRVTLDVFSDPKKGKAWLPVREGPSSFPRRLRLFAPG